LRHLLLIFILVIFLVAVTIIPHKVFGDGFTQETLPGASVGNRTVSVFIKINPPIITSESNQDRYLSFRWFDANTNKTVQHVTFLVEITKPNSPLIHGLFHTHTGILTLKITPSNNPSEWKIIGYSVPFLDDNMYLPLANGTIGLVAPMLGEGGLYHIYLLLISIDKDQNLFRPQDSPSFDSYLSVGDVANHKIDYHNNSYSTTLISYYDKTTNYTFDPSKMQISWSMPFDWNAARFEDMPIFVHEELRVPKAFKEFASAPTFTASVNGISIVNSKVVADPYSMSDMEIIHILINKNDIENLTKVIPIHGNTMNFTVVPVTTGIKTSSSVTTNFGGWEIKLEWNPNNILGDSQNDLHLTFSDAYTEKKVMGDVNYDLMILDKEGNTEFSRIGLTAKNGTDTQLINIPSNGIYNVEINIKSIVNHNLPDKSRIGLARGNLVIPSIINESTVPEFGSLVEVVIMIAILVVITLSKKLFQVQILYPK